MKSEFLQLFELHPVLFFIAASSSLLFFLKLIIFAVSGLGESHGMGDLGDFDDGAGPGSSILAFKLLSFQTLLAFVMTFAWSSLVFQDQLSYSPSLAYFLATLLGIGMMLFSIWGSLLLSRLQEVAVLDPESLKGLEALTYIVIPPKGQGLGQVLVMAKGAKRVMQATQEGESPIPSFTKVRVISMSQGVVLVEVMEKS